MNTLVAYRSVAASRILAAFAALLVTAAVVALPEALLL